MKCIDCKSNDDCKLKDVDNTIVGCDGPSIRRELLDGEVVCRSCDKIVPKFRAFVNEHNKDATCFSCY